LKFGVDLAVQANSILIFIQWLEGLEVVGGVHLVLDAHTDLVDPDQILLPMSAALQLVFVLNALLHHLLADYLPGLPIDRKKNDEFLVQPPVPKVLPYAPLHCSPHQAPGVIASDL
jgi:hypothetical protein